MAVDLVKSLLKLIKCEIWGKEKDEIIFLPAFSVDYYQELFLLSKKHDLAHIVGNALIKNNFIIDGEIKNQFNNEIFTAVYRYENLNHETEELRRVFNEEKIEFIFLKGAVIRKFYPESWLRTSCDIDVLVKKDDINKIARILQEKFSYRKSGNSGHDVSFFSPSGFHIELHFGLVETDETIDATDELLSRAWEFSKTTGETFERQFIDEFFYFYHVAHMAKHFKNGGCGIKPFIDLKIIKDSFDFDEKTCKDLLLQGGLSKFAENCENLSEIWFGNGKRDALSDLLENYVLCGGVYGSAKNKASVPENEEKKSCIIKKIFKPYEELKIWYPLLEKHKWLLPFCQIKRWCRIVFGGTLKRHIGERRNKDLVSETEKNISKKLFDQLGLN